MDASDPRFPAYFLCVLAAAAVVVMEAWCLLYGRKKK